ncbi:F-type H+-transporting ATPase subunit gamma [Roseimicrobium gellanilyticum]|uniref:ATP synthase gamma chain n=2 Tax=root TaxID=1 RepID=A0A366H5L3_9BACT|nr:ATP synthase F1 subunit gamma [Roseimicrobium gellanilyticum]RBP37349.1 F-type H+-transporting ATPase subunit gamma [Roseimicrobium gellanilyticum]
MPSTRDIRRRIKSVKNTAQITKAMQLVAAAKMKKAQDQATNGRPYAELLNKVLVSLREGIEEGSHPYFVEGKGGKTLVILITSDKGLCGALNTNLLKKLIAADLPGEVEFVTIGRKGAQSLSRLRKKLIADFPIKDPAKFLELRTVGNFVQEKFLTGEYAKVLVAFNNFINTVTIVPTVEQLLPVNPVTLGGKRDFEGMSGVYQPTEQQAGDNPEYIFEPDARTVFETILPQYVNNTLWQMLLEARASEHSSRMVAMKNATDNAKQLIKDLTLEYNKLRQAAITNELLEITTAKMALE